MAIGYVRLPVLLFKYLSLGLFGSRYILCFMQRMGLSLQDSSNYSEELQASSSEAFAKYVLLIKEFLRLASSAKKQSDKKGKTYAEVLAKGIRTLTHVFRFLLGLLFCLCVRVRSSFFARFRRKSNNPPIP